MPRLVSVFNWQPLHLVNYLCYCSRKREMDKGICDMNHYQYRNKYVSAMKTGRKNTESYLSPTVVWSSFSICDLLSAFSKENLNHHNNIGSSKVARFNAFTFFRWLSRKITSWRLKVQSVCCISKHGWTEITQNVCN